MQANTIKVQQEHVVSIKNELKLVSFQTRCEQNNCKRWVESKHIELFIKVLASLSIFSLYFIKHKATKLRVMHHGFFSLFYFSCGKKYTLHFNLHFNDFKMYNAVAISILTILCNPHQYLVSELFHHPKWEFYAL